MLVAEYEHWARTQRWEQFYNNNKSLCPPPRDDFSMKATEEIKAENLRDTEPHRMTFLWNHAKMERLNREWDRETLEALGRSVAASLPY